MEDLNQEPEINQEIASEPERANDALTPEDLGIDDQKLYAALSYLTVLVLVPLLTRKDDPFINWHAKQGLVILGGFLIAILAAIWLPSLGNLLFVIFAITSLAGLIAALTGRSWKIPGIGQLAEKFNV